MEEPQVVPLETYAVILANLAGRGSTPVATVLGRFGVTAVDFQRADRHYTEQLAQCQVRHKGMLAMTFAAAFAKAHAETGLFEAAGDETPFTAVATSPALASYLRDLSAAPRAAVSFSAERFRPSSMPASRPSSYVSSIPAAATPPTENLDATAELRAIVVGPALPFVDRASVASSAPALPLAALEPSLPFARADTPAGGPAPRGSGAAPAILTVEQYASLCAELATSRQPRALVLRRYGLPDEGAWTREETDWARRLRTDATLAARYAELLAVFRQYLERERA